MQENQTPQSLLNGKIALLNGEDAEYMSPAMQRLFKGHLESQKSKLQEEQEQALNTLRGEDADRLVDPIDLAQRQEQTEREHTRSAQRREQLKRIDVALRKLSDDGGDYGYCVECGAEIGIPRLISQPASIRDVHCADIMESKARQRIGGGVAQLSMG